MPQSTLSDPLCGLCPNEGIASKVKHSQPWNRWVNKVHCDRSVFKAELILHSLCQKLSTLCLRLLRTQKLHLLLKVFHFTTKAPWVNKGRSPRSGKLKFLIYRLVSSLKVFHSTVKAPLVSKPRSGFSLVEVLVGGAISSVIVAGTLKVLSLSVQSSQVVKSSISEQTVNSLIGDIVNSEDECKANFHPNKITGVNNLNGVGSVASLTKGGVNILTKGEVFKNSLEIVDIKLSSKIDPPDDPKVTERDRSLLIYYKKKGLGSLSTLGGEDCTETSPAGCFFYQCKLKYQLTSLGTTVTRCEALDCVSSSMNDSVAGIDCGANKVLQGFDSSGNKICTPKASGNCSGTQYVKGLDSNTGRANCKSPYSNTTCSSSGQFLKGYTANGGRICDTPTKLKNVSCSTGYYLRGFSSSGNKVCVRLPSSNPLRSLGMCSTGYYLRGFSSSGNKVCVRLPSSNPLRSLGTCSTGYYLRGFSSSGNKVCVRLPSSNPLRSLGTCSADYYLKGFSSSGNKVCVRLPNPSTVCVPGNCSADCRRSCAGNYRWSHALCRCENPR